MAEQEAKHKRLQKVHADKYKQLIAPCETVRAMKNHMTQRNLRTCLQVRPPQAVPEVPGRVAHTPSRAHAPAALAARRRLAWEMLLPLSLRVVLSAQSSVSLYLRLRLPVRLPVPPQAFQDMDKDEHGTLDRRDLVKGLRDVNRVKVAHPLDMHHQPMNARAANEVRKVRLRPRSPYRVRVRCVRKDAKEPHTQVL